MKAQYMKIKQFYWDNWKYSMSPSPMQVLNEQGNIITIHAKDSIDGKDHTIWIMF